MNDRVFPHAQAKKLDDPARLTWLPPAGVIGALQLREGMRVADIGAGTGYFTLPIAKAVGASGRVFAVDMQPEMLEIISEKLQQSKTGALVSLHKGDALHIPLETESVDVVLLANIWHELEDHSQVLREAIRILALGGRLAILDWRADFDTPPGPPQAHRISATTVGEFLKSHDCDVLSSDNIGQFSYLLLATARSNRI